MSPETIPPDSAALLRQARQAQRAFENFHRSNLPRVLEVRGEGCDERVGRVCVHFDGGKFWKPPPEPPAIASARERLLDSLSVLGRALPGDHWILGQRIRYMAHLGRWAQAGALLEGCDGGEPWWCDAARGYVLHRSGAVLESLEAFQVARSLMSPEMAREWQDPAPLLDYASNRWIRKPPGMRQEEALARFWMMADPLFLTPGNEGLSEHFARMFHATLHSDAATTLDAGWGAGSLELLLRYGFVAGWERADGPLTSNGGGTVIKHFHPESRGLLPLLEALEDPAGLPGDVWVIDDDRVRSASAPVLSPLMVDATAQTAVLRRGEDILVLAAYGPPADTVLELRRGGGVPEPSGEAYTGSSPLGWEARMEGASQDTLVGLFLLPDTGGWAPLSILGAGGTGILQLRAPPGGYLLSLEAWNPAGRWGARIRHGIRVGRVPPDVPNLSDLLILDAGPALPADLAEAVPRMRTTPTIRASERVTVVWEVYGLGPREQELTFRLKLSEEGGGLVRRALGRLGLFQRPPALTLSWEEGGQREAGPLFRAVEIELPELEPGEYVLRLELEIPFRNAISSIRRVTVR